MLQQRPQEVSPFLLLLEEHYTAINQSKFFFKKKTIEHDSTDPKFLATACLKYSSTVIGGLVELVKTPTTEEPSYLLLLLWSLEHEIFPALVEISYRVARRRLANILRADSMELGFEALSERES
jgi:hypothetical protein